MKISKKSIYFSSLLVAFAGMIYELGLAQILSATLGGTLVRYVVTIGLFTATLGLGALSFEFIIKKYSPEKIFSLFQNILAWIGLLSPFLLIFIKSENIFLSHLPILLIGFLSGVELPLLMSISDEKSKNMILAFDYFGMFAATLLFPLVLLPSWGVISAMLIASLLNAVVGILYSKVDHFLEAKNLSLYLVLGIDLIALFNQERILEYVSQAFI